MPSNVQISPVVTRAVCRIQLYHRGGRDALEALPQRLKHLCGSDSLRIRLVGFRVGESGDQALRVKGSGAPKLLKKQWQGVQVRG